MAKFVIAGRADCPLYAKAEMLADTLVAKLTDFSVHKIMLKPEEWPSWVQEQCQQRGWSHSPTSSPLIWRELIDRGGKGSYLGGLAEFEEYSHHYYREPPAISDTMAAQISAENADTLQTFLLEAQQEQGTPPLHVCVTAASSPLAYHLTSLLLSKDVFKKKDIFLHLYDQPDQLPILKGVAMELTDMAHPHLAGVICTSSLQQALKEVSAAFILDHPGQKQDETSHSEESPISEVAVMYYRYAAMMDFCAQKDVRTVVVGRYSNTGAAIMASTVSSIPKSCFIASPMLAMQQTRAVLADKLNVMSADVEQITIWGPCQGNVVADTSHVKVRHFQGAITGPDPFSLPLLECLFDHHWLEMELPSLLAARHHYEEGYSGRGTNLAAAVGLCQLMKTWWEGEGEWCSVGVVCEGGREGMEEGMVVSQPCICREGVWMAVEGVEVSEGVRKKVEGQLEELKKELEAAMLAVKEHKGQEEEVPTLSHTSKL